MPSVCLQGCVPQGTDQDSGGDPRMLWLAMYMIALIPFAKYTSIGQKANANGEGKFCKTASVKDRHMAKLLS